jgi:zinc transporter, ZIP family
VSDLGASAAWGATVAGGLVAGALVAAGLRLPPRVAATVTAFGGGVLLAAVALELVPEAGQLAGRWLTAAGLLAGMVLYVGADAWLTRDERMREARRDAHAAMVGQPMTAPPAGGGAPRPAAGTGRPVARSLDAARGEAIAAGIFVDGVPESIALGLTVAAGQVGVALLAGVLVGNLVEAYGAAQPIIAAGRSRRFAVGLLAGIGVALAGATVLGGTVLADAAPALIGTAEALASGAVLAVVSVSIIPYAFSQVSSMVGAAAVVGFIAGYLIG